MALLAVSVENKLKMYQLWHKLLGSIGYEPICEVLIEIS